MTISEEQQTHRDPLNPAVLDLDLEQVERDDDEAEGEVSSARVLRVWWSFLRPYQRKVITAAVLFALRWLTSVFIAALLISIMVNRLQAMGVHHHFTYGPLEWPFIGAAGCYLSQYVTDPLIDKLWWTAQFDAFSDMHTTVLDKYLSLGYRFFSDHVSGELVTKAESFVDGFGVGSDQIFYLFANLVWTLVFAAVIMAFKLPIYSLGVLLWSFVYFLVLRRDVRKVFPLFTKDERAWSMAKGHRADALGTVNVVKAFGREGAELALAQAHMTRVLYHQHKVLRGALSTMRRRYTVLVTVNIGAVALALYSVVDHHVPLGTAFLVFSYTEMILSQMSSFEWPVRTLVQKVAKSKGMVEIFDLEPEVRDRPEPLDLVVPHGQVTFENVTFGYRPTDLVFDGFNLAIKPGEHVGVVGVSGNGKTTLTHLLLRFMDVDDGAIRIDGTDIRDVRQSDLRHNIAYVPQDPALFHRSIFDNIAYGNAHATMDEVRAVARAAHAAEFIEVLPEGYDTLVGERGVKLSGGQRQRLAIARAMLTGAPILVLDEATSALDSESEALVAEALWTLMERRTAIVIAHRLSTIAHMDRIVVLDKGRIVEEGSHRELLALGGLGVYGRLWHRQSGGFLP